MKIKGKIKEKMKMKHFLPILAVICIAALYWMATISKPIVVEMDEIGKYEGKRVIVEGIVVDKISSDYGETIKIIDGKNWNDSDNKGITIFTDDRKPISYGDKIRVIGKVQRYRGKWELISNEIEIIDHWESNSFPLWQLAQYPWRYTGTNINVTGYVKNLHPSYFYLIDEEERYSIKVLYGENATIDNIEKYDRVCVKARFLYDEEKFSFYLECKQKDHAIMKIC
jgi:DNA/RNA endonuclease YhcR with UshA esterase domain